MAGNYHQYEHVIRKLKDANSSIVGVSQQEYIQKQTSNSHIFHVIDSTTVAYYFFKNSIAISKLEKFRTLINKSVEKKYVNIHLYFPESPSNSILKEITALNQNINIRIQYLKHYNIELENGPHCSKHEIMSPKEIENEITRSLRVAVHNLPSIPVNDAQLQMLSVKTGDVIRITNANCRIAGNYITYRVVRGRLEHNEAMDKSENRESEDEVEFEEEPLEKFDSEEESAESDIFETASESETESEEEASDNEFD